MANIIGRGSAFVAAYYLRGQTMYVKLMAAAIAVSVGLCCQAQASVTISIDQSGSDVTMTANGTFDLTGMTLYSTYFSSTTGVRGMNADYALVGPQGNTIWAYTGLTGPTAIGASSTLHTTMSSSGDNFGLVGSNVVLLYVPAHYVSGSNIAGTAKFANTTIANLGLTVGQYTFTGPHDTVAIKVNAPVVPIVPEASAWAMLLLGFFGVGFAMRRRQRTIGVRVRYAR